jgi:hypothetical protein
MVLPDNAFFELLRSVFGNIKTPFSKPKLLADLAAFFSREDIQKALVSYIDEGDAKVIAAVALLGDPAPGELETFFAGDLSLAGLQDMILNLEERFILFRFRDRDTNRLALNPVLEPALAPFVSRRRILFPFLRAAGQEAALPPDAPSAFDTRIMMGIVSLIDAEPRFFRVEGSLRKRVSDRGERIFPGIDLESAVKTMQVLGLFRSGGDGLVPDVEKLRAFGALPPRERLEYCAAGYCCFRDPAGSPAGVPFSRNRVRALAGLFHAFVDLADPDHIYPPQTLGRFLTLLERERPFYKAGGEWRGGIRLEDLLEGMKRAGLLAGTASACRISFPEPQESPPAREAVLAMDSPFSFIMYPRIAFEDALTLALFSEIREAGAAVRFELTRNSAVRGFDRGLGADKMIGLLKRLSGDRVSGNCDWTLRDWEKRYGEVSLRRGIVLCLSEDRRYLAGAEPVKDLVRETLAPGVYLLSAPETEAAVQALRKAGVDIIARESQCAPVPAAHEAFPPPPAFPGPGGRAAVYDAAEGPAVSSGPGEAAAAGELKKRFRAALDKMRLSAQEREELASRIGRRLILSESQLDGASIRYEKLEARGLDYVGKAAIAKQAIVSGSLLEVSWPRPGSSPNRARGIPRALEKSGGESILVLEPETREGPEFRNRGHQEALRIPIGKISVLRRIKRSIFGE